MTNSSKRFWILLGLIPLLLVGVVALTGANRDSNEPPPPLPVPNTHATSLSQAFRSAAEYVQPSLVMIRSEKTSHPDMSLSQFDDDGMLGELLRKHPELRQFRAVPQVPRQQAGIGSGVIIDKSGVILTNNHVVAGGDRIMVRLHDGREFEATEIKTDPKTDLAIVKIDGSNLRTAVLGDSDLSQVGDWVIALGQPFGLEGTVTAGIISGKGRGIGITDRESFIQTDAAINPGNSGGPLVNLKGEVIGINTAISSRSGGNDGIGFAVPVNLAKWVSRQLVNDGVVQRAYLGVNIQPVDHQLAKQFNIKAGEGVLVAGVQESSPASDAGIRVGDVITQFDGKVVKNPRELQLAVERSQHDKNQLVTLIRDGKVKEIDVHCRPHVESNRPVDSSRPSSAESNEWGLEVSDLDESVARRLGLRDNKGAVVTNINPGGVADKAGIRTGMAIVEVNRTAVADAEHFAELSKDTDEMLLLVRTQNGSRYLVLTTR